MIVMEVGRREFLAVFGGILAKLAVQPSPAVYQQGDVYINRRLGLAFSRPAGWNFVHLDEMGQMQQGHMLAVDDPDENARILQSLSLPFVALSPETAWDSSATVGIQFYLADPPPAIDVVSIILHEAFGKEYKGSPESRFSPPMQIVCRDRHGARELLSGFCTISLPRDITAAHCPAAEYTATYEFRHRDLHAPRTIRVRSLVIQHQSRFYLLRLIDTEELAVDFSLFLESLRLA